MGVLRPLLQLNLVIMKVLGSLLKAYIFWLINLHVNLYSLCYFVISIESLISGENKYLCSEGDAGRNEVRLLRPHYKFFHISLC